MYKIIKISEVNILFNSIFYVRKHINKNVGGGSWVCHGKPMMNKNLQNQKCLYLHVNKWVQNGPFYPADELLNGLQTTVWTLYYAVYSHTWFSDHLC